MLVVMPSLGKELYRSIAQEEQNPDIMEEGKVQLLFGQHEDQIEESMRKVRSTFVVPHDRPLRVHVGGGLLSRCVATVVVMGL